MEIEVCSIQILIADFGHHASRPGPREKSIDRCDEPFHHQLRVASLQKATLNLLVLHDLTPVQLVKTPLDLGEEVDPLHHVLETSVRRELLQGVKDTLLDTRRGHMGLRAGPCLKSTAGTACSTRRVRRGSSSPNSQTGVQGGSDLLDLGSPRRIVHADAKPD